MSELLRGNERTLAAGLRQGLGVAACAGCPFAELGCPSKGTGDCPPPEVIESKQATPLLENDDADEVWAGADGGFYGLRKPKEQFAKQVAGIEPVLQIPRGGLVTIPKGEAVRAKRQPRQLTRPFGDLAVGILLPAKKAK